MFSYYKDISYIKFWYFLCFCQAALALYEALCIFWLTKFIEMNSAFLSIKNSLFLESSCLIWIWVIIIRHKKVRSILCAIVSNCFYCNLWCIELECCCYYFFSTSNFNILQCVLIILFVCMYEHENVYSFVILAHPILWIDSCGILTPTFLIIHTMENIYALDISFHNITSKYFIDCHAFLQPLTLMCKFIFYRYIIEIVLRFHKR